MLNMCSTIEAPTLQDPFVFFSESRLPFLHVTDQFSQRCPLNFPLSDLCCPFGGVLFCVKAPDVKLNLISKQY